jgi:O-antigen/teichoic acid export membrane protein
MQRKFLTNLGFLLLVNLIIKPIWIFGIDLTVQNTVGAEQYGFYFNLFNFSFLFNILCDFGITNFNNRNIAQNNQLLNKHFSSIVILKILLGFFYLILTLLAAFFWGYDSDEIYMLIFLGINQFLISFILYLRSNVSGLLMFKTDSILSVLDRVVMIAICSILLWGGVTQTSFQIQWFVYAQTIAYIITAIVALAIVIRKAYFKRLNWNYPFFLMILKQSLPFAILVLLMSFYNRLDTVMLVRLLEGSEGKIQSGIYAHSYRLLDASNNIAYLFSLILLPIFARLIKTKGKISDIVKLSFSILFVISVTVTAICFTYKLEIIDFLYDHYIQESARLFPVLMACFIAISTTYVFGTLLTANGNLKHLNYLAAAGMVLNLVLNLILIPRWGAYGSAWASFVTQMIMALLQVILSVLFFNFKVSFSFILKLVFFIAGVAITIFIIKLYSLQVLPGCILIMAGSLVFSAILRLLNISSFIRILRSK